MNTVQRARIRLDGQLHDVTIERLWGGAVVLARFADGSSIPVLGIECEAFVPLSYSDVIVSVPRRSP